MLKVTHQNTHVSCIYVYISVILSSLTLLSASFLSSSTTFADDSVVDQINITVSESCSMTGVGMDSHTATITNGTYQNNIGTTTISVFCNDSAGFAIYAIGFTEDKYTGEDHTKLIGAANNQKITTGTATSGNTSNWAMKLATDSNATYPITLDNSYGSYNQVPNTYTKVAHRDSGTDVGTNATGAELTTTYAAYMSTTQVADTYTGKVKYTLVHPSSSEAPLHPETTQSGQICYYPNGGNVEGTMGCQTITSSDTSATLLASNFSRTGYGFAGWSTTFDYSDSTGFLGPSEDITFTAGQYTGSNPGLSLYAHWIKSDGDLQGFTCPNNTSMPIGTVTALTDQRDNQTYAVAKLADSNCWMIENLRLENTGTDNTNGSLAQGYDASFAGLADPEELWLFNNYITTANTIYSIDGSTTKTISGSNQAYRFPRYNNINTSTRASTPSTNDDNMHSYGNYYTWAAAIADTTSYTTNNQSVISTSICPTGWHLPKGGNNKNTANNEFLAFSEALIGAKPVNYNSQTYPNYTGTPEGTDASKVLRSYPNNFVYSGNVIDSVYGRGAMGNYWSSTVYSSSRTYYLDLGSSLVSPGTVYFDKYYGRSIRCVTPGV